MIRNSLWKIIMAEDKKSPTPTSWGNSRLVYMWFRHLTYYRAKSHCCTPPRGCSGTERNVWNISHPTLRYQLPHLINIGLLLSQYSIENTHLMRWGDCYSVLILFWTMDGKSNHGPSATNRGDWNCFTGRRKGGSIWPEGRRLHTPLL